MPVFFVFSDEAGSYRQNRSEKFLKAHPFYVRASLIISADDWIRLNSKYLKIKGEYAIPKDKEFKWSFIWSLKKSKTDGTLTKKDEYYFLKNYTEEDLIAFVIDCLKILTECSFCKLIFTITFNSLVPRINEADLYKMHLQDTMQRIEMEIQNKSDNLAIIFLDPVGLRNDSNLRQSYHEIYIHGDFIQEHSCIEIK